MENDALKFRVFIPVENRYMDNNIDNPIIDSSGNLMWCYLDKIGNLKRYEHNLLNRERAVIERCTGLRDKNNKLIYEGDVLQAPGQTIAYKVQWAHHGFVVKAGFSSEKSYPMSNCEMFEIIGTIHDDQFRDAAKMVERQNDSQ